MSGGVRFTWTVGALEDLRAFNKINGDLDQLVKVMGCTRAEADEALWQLLGRTPEEALEAMIRKLENCA